MEWRLAYSLDTLRSQINTKYPSRNKASDGTIGDDAHQAVASDHNPNAEGVVCALDITNSPETDFDAHLLADRLLEVRHPDLKYIISNGRIAGEWTGWQWATYSGTSDPHIQHIHVSVGVGPDGESTQPYDDKINWNIGEEDMFNEADRKNLNVQFFGKDVSICKSMVGKSYHDAIYEMLSPSDNNPDKFMFHFKVNSGDVKNINTMLGLTNAETVHAQNWKDVFYGYIGKVWPSGNKPKPLPPGVYEVK
jgi:hypothetical protein